MYAFEIKPDLQRKLHKIQKKDPVFFKAVRNKIQEAVQNPQHYKNLKYDMSDFKEMHIMKSFVLLFKVDEENKVVHVYELEHHDKVFPRHT